MATLSRRTSSVRRAHPARSLAKAKNLSRLGEVRPAALVGGRKPNAAGRRLRRLIEEGLVDCYGEDEQHGAFLVMLEEHVACPFKARIVGEEVEVLGFDWNDTGREIMAVCRRKGRRYRVGVTALEWTGRPPTGAVWFDAYRAWLRGTW